MSSIKCPNCGLTNFSAAEECKRCGKPIRNSIDLSFDINRPPGIPLVNSQQEPLTQDQKKLMTLAQGYILIALLGLIFVLFGWSTFKQQPKFEYRILEFMAASNERTGAGALAYSSVRVNEGQLAEMGADGWELVDTILEMETAYPNFGDSSYVTGLQPNIRPQRAVLFFKRQVK